MPERLQQPENTLEFDRIRRGTPAFFRTNLALFSAGWATFALLYGIQPLMPVFTQVFKISPAASSLIVSSTTGTIAVALLFMGSLSETLGRKSLMSCSLTASAILTFCVAFAPNFGTILILRTLTGLAMSGIPAIAMAYISEEMDPGSLGLAMGLFIAGSGLGGMSGRLIIAALTDYFSWRTALAVTGVLALGSAAIFWRSLPPSRHFQSKPWHAPTHLKAFCSHLTDNGLPWLFACGFLMMGSFVTLYNYAGFRLMAQPFNLSQSQIGLLFSVYLAGMVSSTLAGSLADRFGRRKVMWLFVSLFLAGVLLTLSNNLWTIVLAIGIATSGFFGAHSIASSWIGRRALQNKAQASSLYLFFYYLGSSILGSVGGVVWSHGSWHGLVVMLTILLSVTLLISVKLSLLKPIVLQRAAVIAEPASGI